MANFGNLAGPLLQGIGQGLMAAPQQAEDLSYLRQSRQNNLQQAGIKNAADQLALQQQQTAVKDDQDYRAAALAGWRSAQTGGTDNNAPPAQKPSGAPVDADERAVKPISGGLPALQKANMSVADINDYAKKHNLPPEMVYGFLASESGGDRSAVSPKGAVGLFQSMPSTAADPGYGVKPYDPNSIDGSLDYMSAMFKQAGGDPVKAAQFWNAGVKGNPNNPETKGFVANVQKNADLFKQAQAADQAGAQPSPTAQLAAREAAGVKTTPGTIATLQQQQQQQLQQLVKSGQTAMQNGNPVVAQKFFAQAAALQASGTELATKSLAVQKAANDETAKLAASVKDQVGYNGLLSQIQENPAMRSAVRGLNLTGDYETDRPKLATLAERSLTLKDQQDLQMKRQELALKQQTETRQQAKQDEPKIQAANAQAADEARKATVTAQGLPFAPSLETQMPGATPGQIATARAKNEALRNTYVTKSLQPAINATREVQVFASELTGLLDEKGGAVTTGGIGRIPGIGALLTGVSPDRQQFEKAANNLVTAKQQALAAIGEGRSAGTAAMAKIIGTTKPSLDVSPEVNRVIVKQIHIVTQMAAQQAQFTGDYLRANPAASPAAAALEWSRYENSLGALVYADPKAHDRMRFNDAAAKTNPDGSDNPNYKDWHTFFKDHP